MHTRILPLAWLLLILPVPVPADRQSSSALRTQSQSMEERIAREGTMNPNAEKRGTLVAGKTTLLSAISMVESGDNDFAVGRAGERSRYQMLPGVWRKFTKSRDYTNPIVARTVSGQHLAWLIASFPAAAGRPATDEDLIVCWQWGITGYRRLGFQFTRLPASSQDRARRIQNLLRL